MAGPLLRQVRMKSLRPSLSASRIKQDVCWSDPGGTGKSPVLLERCFHFTGTIGFSRVMGLPPWSGLSALAEAVIHRPCFSPSRYAPACLWFLLWICAIPVVEGLHPVAAFLVLMVNLMDFPLFYIAL